MASKKCIYFNRNYPQVDEREETGFIDDFIKSDNPDSTCLIDQGKIFSYAEIDNLVSRLSSFISGRIRSRDARVAIFLPNSWEFFVVLYATIRAGGIWIITLDKIIDEACLSTLIHLGIVTIKIYIFFRRHK